jgi:hypothetical protein
VWLLLYCGARLAFFRVYFGFVEFKFFWVLFLDFLWSLFVLAAARGLEKARVMSFLLFKGGHFDGFENAF